MFFSVFGSYQIPYPKREYIEDDNEDKKNMNDNSQHAKRMKINHTGHISTSQNHTQNNNMQQYHHQQQQQQQQNHHNGQINNNMINYQRF